MKLTKETINNVYECCDCEWCGFPMYENEVVFIDENWNTFCSEVCATDYQTKKNEFTNLKKE